MIRRDVILSVLLGLFLTGTTGVDQQVYGYALNDYDLHPAKVYTYINISDPGRFGVKRIFLAQKQQEEKEIPPAPEKEKVHPPQKKSEGLPPKSDDHVPKKEGLHKHQRPREGERAQSDDHIPPKGSGKQQSGGSTSVFPGCTPSR